MADTPQNCLQTFFDVYNAFCREIKEIETDQIMEFVEPPKSEDKKVEEEKVVE